MKRNSWLYFVVKRLFDFLSSLIAIVAISPILIIILIINTFATGGAPVYIDRRVGKNGKVLNIPKFRSMHYDANDKAKYYLNKKQMKQWKTERKVHNDPRVTKFGKFLRVSSLDETLQLFCILFGTMSVIGPRPITEDEINQFFTEEERKVLLSAKPGLISNWGVNGRNLVTYKSGKRQKLELDYFKKRSIGYDLLLIFKAVGSVVSHKGAE